MKTEEIRSKKVMLGPVQVSQVCFGTEHINKATPNFGADILISAARDHGVFFWDTDNAYGSQSQVAAAIRQISREEAVVCSKTYGRTREEAVSDLERTLYELNTDYLDIYLLHEVGYGTLEKKRAALEYLMEAKQQGKVRGIGLSTHSASIVHQAADMPEIEIVCAPFNREGSRIEQGTLNLMKSALKKAHGNGKGTYIIKVLGRGELIYDLKGALEWAMAHHEFIDVYNLGVANLAELRQNVSIVNAYYAGLGGTQ